MNELVLLQVLAALGDVSGHVEKIHHGQAGWMLLFAWRQSLILATAWCGTIKGSKAADYCCSSSSQRRQLKEPHQPGSGLPQEGLEVSAGHQLQQDEPGHGLQADSHAAHDVLVAEFAGRDKKRATYLWVCFFLAASSIKKKQTSTTLEALKSCLCCLAARCFVALWPGCFSPDDQRLHEEVQLVLLGANLRKSLWK